MKWIKLPPTLNQGNASQGGAIFNDGRLNITSSSVFSSHAPGGIGGAIYNTSVATITGSTLSDNAASAGLAALITPAP